MTKVNLTEVLRRLDQVDGQEDGKYSDFPLHGENATGVCEARQSLWDQANAKQTTGGKKPFQGDQFRASLHTPSGEIVDVDCDVLAERFDLLVGILKNNPVMRFLASAEKEKSIKNDIPAPEDLLVYHIADHMLSALLLGIGTTDESWGELFADVAIPIYVDDIRATGRFLAQVIENEDMIDRYRDFQVSDIQMAYAIFSNHLTRYGMDPKPFAPVETILECIPMEELETKDI